MTPETKRERKGEKKEYRGPNSLTPAKPISPLTSPIRRSLTLAKHFYQTHPLQYPIHPSEDRLHPSLITDPQTPKTHLSDRQPRPTPPASRSRHHHPRPTTLILRSPAMHRQVQVELSSRSRPTQDRSSPFALTNLSFPQSLNLSLFDLWFFCCCCGGVMIMLDLSCKSVFKIKFLCHLLYKTKFNCAIDAVNQI